MQSDPFSDLLQLADAQTVLTGGFEAGGRWAVRFRAPDKIKFFAVVQGHCWLRVDGEEPRRIDQGDVFLLAAPRSFVLASDRTCRPVDAADVFTLGPAGNVARIGSGADFALLGGHVRLEPVSGPLLMQLLPSLVHVRAASPQATTLQWLLDQLVRERRAALPGAKVASTQLAHLLFVQVLRAHLAESGPLEAGWLRAVSDPAIAPALRLMHAHPERAWRLEDLAHAAAMSRTTFALRFKLAAGMAPLAYLTEWRMRLAQRALREGKAQVAELARSLGYGSESAFSNAFKRVTGQAPRRYRLGAQAPAKS